MSHSRVPDRLLVPLAAELTLAIGQLVRRLRTEAHPDELNMSESATLARLEREGPKTTADLARAESMKPQSMKAILAGLEEEGCVERQPHPTDGRQILFVLTAKGIEQRRRRKMAKHEWLAKALADLDDTQLRTLTAAIAVIKRLGESWKS